MKTHFLKTTSDNIGRILLLYKIFVRRIRIVGYMRLVAFLIRKYCFFKEIPVSLMIAITYECQCNCVHCAASKLKDQIRDELSTEEIKTIIDEACNIGVLKIGFTGGEPLLRDDITGLVRYAYEKGFSTSIDTNGLLVTDKILSELKTAGITNINISIDHPIANYHDKLRQSKGCFDRAVKAISSCVRERIPCVVSTYITDRSMRKSELKDVIDLAKILKADAVRVLFPIYSGKFYSRKKTLLSEANKKLFFSSYIKSNFVYSESPFFDFLTSQMECSAGKKLSFYITAYGDVKYCYVSNDILGNIRLEPLRRILNKNLYFNSNGKVNLSCISCEDKSPVCRES